MSGQGQLEDQILVAVHEGIGYVHVRGRGTFKVSSALKKFGQSTIADGCGRIVLDMAECVGMDSTFMGVLAGLATELQRRASGPVILVNLSEKTRGLLATLGLDQIVHSHVHGSATPAEPDLTTDVLSKLQALEAGGESRCETAETMLEAHENLVGVSPENYPRFKDVLTFLREDLEKACQNEGGEAPPA